eukprot:Partr_v1_DN24850_c0_g1_i1_m29484 putative Guanine nucleotide binding protein (G protein) alpha
MGNCASDNDIEADDRSREIDEYLRSEQREVEKSKDLKILLLGSGESGKSTIVKQMKIIHLDGFSQQELAEYKVAIAANVIEAMTQLIKGIQHIQMPYEDAAIQDLAQRFLKETENKSMHECMSQAMADMIVRIWRDPTAQTAIEKTSSFYIMDSAQYFFDNVKRIAEPGYVPTNDDILRSRVKTTGIAEIKFTLDKLKINMFDVGGQRSERKKWIHSFEGVTSVIFIVALSEYDQVLLEDSSQNRIAESLVLFENIVNSRWFIKSSIILFLNKIDLFKIKLRRTPLSRHFPEYAGDDDFAKASKFILWRFKQVNRQNLTIYPHLTCATDTSQIRVVFTAVKDTLIKNSLKNVGIM